MNCPFDDTVKGIFAALMRYKNSQRVSLTVSYFINIFSPALKSMLGMSAF